ncbi:hypothetical protein [Bradyrhizobium sp. CSS354]|nr:hypothetical protein [Bradyrhizobium sp. CSS354]MDE5465222.1 hypothetical protein [Bradyrhizobium sp. CSS354]
MVKARLGLNGISHLWRQSSGSIDLDHACLGIFAPQLPQRDQRLDPTI